MIKVKISKTNNLLSSIKISGHSEYSNVGYDIVCASVSSIVVTTVNGILSINKTIKVSDDGEILQIMVLKHNEVTDKLLENMIKLFEGLEIQYKKNIQILTKGE